MSVWVRRFLAGMVGLGATLLLNRLFVWWLNATIFTSDTFYDGCAALLTLALPAFLGSLPLGWIARAEGLSVAAVTFVLVCCIGFVHPFWRIPPVNKHSGFMHYFLFNPLVALAFGALGGWFASQFAIGKFTLADDNPVFPGEMN